MRRALAVVILAGCAGGDSTTIDQPLPLTDAGVAVQPDAQEVIDAAVSIDAPVAAGAPTGAACSSPSDCAGGACVGIPGQPLNGSSKFAGGYCTRIGCTLDSQDGCGVDEWCIDGGDAGGGICVSMCTADGGIFCQREDHVCLGLGNFGGCFSKEAVECMVVDKQGTGCPEGDLCIKIGFDDTRLGRCETSCDPMDNQCAMGRGCYLIRAYNLAFCGTPGKAELGEPCDCDRCCVPGLGCTRNDDGPGSTCRNMCVFATGEGCAAGERCKALNKNQQGEPISTWGGCMPP
jgi:hypothetical protein